MSAKRTQRTNESTMVHDGTPNGAIHDAGVAVEELAEDGVGGSVIPRRKPGKATSADHLEALESKPVVIKPITIPKLDIRTLEVRLVGDAPLIVHRFSEKQKKQMLDKQMGVASEGRAFKDPEKDFEESLYKLPGGKFGFPSIAFKNAAVTACTSLGKAITKTAARQCFHVTGDMVEIVSKPTMREDTVRIGQGTADIRYRGQFEKWSCTLAIRYNARVLSDEQLIALLNLAGFAVGVGEWRPERDGQFGLFHVALKHE